MDCIQGNLCLHFIFLPSLTEWGIFKTGLVENCKLLLYNPNFFRSNLNLVKYFLFYNCELAKITWGQKITLVQ